MGFSKFADITAAPVSKPEVLLIDYSNLAMRCLHSLPYDPLDESFKRWRLLMMGSIKKSIRDRKPDKVIFCMEGGNNWRKLYYPQYKANRVYGKPEETADGKDDAKHTIDFDKFFAESARFVRSLAAYIPNTQFLCVPGSEADDLIAIITKSQQQWNVTCQSSDRDFYQLFKYPNYKQYDGIKRKFIEVINPEMYLLEKIIVGDGGDNVPQLKQKIGPKRAEAIINSEEGLEAWLKKENLEKEFERNRTLISFDCIPEEVQFNIRTAVESFEPKKFDPRKTMDFLVENDLAAMFDDFNVFINLFTKLDPKE